MTRGRIDSWLTTVLTSALLARRQARRRSQAACELLAQEFGVSEIEADSLILLVAMGHLSKNTDLRKLAPGFAVLEDADLPRNAPISFAVQARREASEHTDNVISYLCTWLRINDRSAAASLLLLLERAAAQGVLRYAAERWASAEGVSWDCLTVAVAGEAAQSR